MILSRLYEKFFLMQQFHFQWSLRGLFRSLSGVRLTKITNKPQFIPRNNKKYPKNRVLVNFRSKNLTKIYHFFFCWSKVFTIETALLFLEIFHK